MIEEGIGLHQIRGRAIEEFQPGEPFWTPAGVEHWHGAHPEVDALQLTIYEGTVTGWSQQPMSNMAAFATALCPAPRTSLNDLLLKGWSFAASPFFDSLFEPAAR